MDLGPELPRPEKERIVTGNRRRPQGPPPEPLRPGPPPRADAVPPPAPPQIPEGVEIIRREMDSLIREISEGVRRTAGDVSESDRLTEINDRLVNFVQGVMEALSRLLEHIEAYNTQMTELTKQLGVFRTQIGKSSGKTDKAAKDAATRLTEFKNMVTKSLQGMKNHLRAEDMVPLQQALNNWDQLMSLASKAPATKAT
jgi:ABC-type transporter Mla subunit MlaD